MNELAHLRESIRPTVGLNSLTSLIDNLEEGVLFLDEGRRVLAINKPAQDMIGMDVGGEVKQLTGRLCPSLFRGTECARACERSGQCSLIRQKREKKVQDISIQRADGSMISLRMWAISLPPEEPVARCAIVLRNRTRERQLEEEVSERLRLGGLIGHSRPMQDLFRQILRIAMSEATVLITGESGTGKELVARALHENSSRANGPYVRVHCAAFPENLLEAELFGHAKGAFTGAVAARAGRFEAADGGTILLDEIGEISPSIQVKLLRVLQEREVERLGENRPRKVDVRIITATHRDIGAMVRVGEFREDLYYRLRVLPLHVPPLRERREDIPMLAQHLLADMARRYKREDAHITDEAMRSLVAHAWPGNVRELVNALEYALVHAEGAAILPRHLPPEVQQASEDRREAVAAARPVAASLSHKPYYRPANADEEKVWILEALRAAGGNKAEAARQLGMSRTTLWKKLKIYGIK